MNNIFHVGIFGACDHTLFSKMIQYRGSQTISVEEAFDSIENAQQSHPKKLSQNKVSHHLEGKFFCMANSMEKSIKIRTADST